jgi:hypothetical protein
MVYKDLQKKTYPPLRSKIYTPPTQIKQTLRTQPGVSYAQVTKYRARATYKTISSTNQRYAGIKKYYEKPFRTNGKYDKLPHNRDK